MTREEYFETVEEQVRCKKAIPMIRKELVAHIDDQKDFYLQAGKEENEAERLAVLEMGDPVETGTELDKVHRPKMDWSIVFMVAGIAIFGIVMQCIIFSYMDGDFASEYPFKTVFYNVIGFVVMCVIMRIDYRMLEKYIWQIYVIYLVCSAILFYYTNGSGYGVIRLTGNLVYMCFVPIFAGFVYHFREEKLVGLLKSFGVVLFNNVVTFVLVQYSVVACGVTQIACFVVVFASVLRGIFKGKKLLQIFSCFVLWLAAPIVVLLDILLAAGKHIGLAQYQVARLMAMLGLLEDSTTYVSEVIKNEIGQAEVFGGGTIGRFEYVSGAHCDYVLTCTVTYLGIGVAMIVVLVIAMFLFRAFWISAKQKNNFGFLLGISVSVVLIMKSIIYIAVNLGLIQGGAVDMPFMTFGWTTTLLNYTYMGIILSVYRHTNLIAEFHKAKKIA